MDNLKNKTEKKEKPLTQEELASIRQNSKYNSDNKAAPDNNIFFEARSNPLSSKGN